MNTPPLPAAACSASPQHCADSAAPTPRTGHWAKNPEVEPSAPHTVPESVLPAAHAMLDQLPDGIWLVDPDSARLVWANRAGCTLVGMTLPQLLHKTVFELEKDIFGMQQWREMVAAIRTLGNYVFLGEKIHHNGQPIAVEVNASCITENGREYLMGVIRDIRPRLSEQQVEVSRNYRLWFAMHEAFDGMWDWNIRSDEVFFSPRLKKMLGHTSNEMPNYWAHWQQSIHPEDRTAVVAAMQDHLQRRRERYEAEYRIRNHNGSWLWVHECGRVCERDEHGDASRMVGMLHNITDRKKLELSLHDMALHDALTGLPNRHKAAHFFSRLQQRHRSQPTLSTCVALMDMDYFKKINDIYGHPVGDKVLIMAAQILQNSLRARDFVARWGGEEFLIVLPETHIETARVVIERIFNGFCSASWHRETGIPHVTFSMGVACFEVENHEDFYTTVNVADKALYHAKNNGRRQCIVIDPQGQYHTLHSVAAVN